MEKLSPEDNFNLVADRIEAQLHGDVRIVVESDYKGELHLEVQEIADEDDEDPWGDPCLDGYFTINEKRGFKNYDEAAAWLESQYL